MKQPWKIWLFASLTILGIIAVLDIRMQAKASIPNLTFDVSEPITPVLSLAVRDLQSIQDSYLSRETNPIQWLGEGVGEEGPSIGMDPLAPLGLNSGITPNPLVTFEGVPSLSGVTPPDTNGDVGPNHYIQMTNFHFQIWDKGDPENGIPPSVLAGPIALGTFFAPLGGGCGSNYGDPYVIYDDLADRWLLTQFNLSASLGMCLAVSTTPDPLGTYYMYNIPTPDFPDYPKLSAWPDAYYMTTNTGFPNQYYAHAFDRVAMLAGAPATRQSFGGLPNLMLPADVDGPVPPPAGDPGIFYTYFHPSATGHPPGAERLAFYEFDVDWVTPANSTYTLVAELPVAPFNYTICGFFAGGCIQQPGTGQLLDDIAWWPMYRMQYRNFGNYEAMVGNFTVDADGANHAGIRWFEVRKTGNTYSLYQEGTYFPDTDSRWMGSIAMDISGNLALGYSVSSSTTIPSIRYATRLASDPLGTFNAEAEMWAGGGVQTGIHRWGDYSAMTVDPVDGCTFWFTTEYHDANDSGFGWNTRIGVFKLDECGSPYSVEATPVNVAACILTTDEVDYTILVGQNDELFTDAVTLSTVTLPPNITDSFSVNPVTPSEPPATSTLTLSGITGSTAGIYTLDVIGEIPTRTVTATVQLSLYDALSATASLLTPADGETNVSPAPTFSWTAVSGAQGYDVEVATDENFTNIVYTASVTDTTHAMAVALNELFVYYWRVRPTNICGTGDFSNVFSFSTRDVPSILVVDDDDNSPNVRTYYTQPLDDLGWTYDIWNTNNSDDEPTATDLAPYSAVIWFTGDETGGFAGPDETNEAALATWLDNTQGCFFLSSQDYFKDRTLTDFMTNYLGVGTLAEGTGDYSQVIGQGVYSSLGTRSLLYPFTDSADWITPDSTAEIGIIGTNERGAALTKEDGYKTTFWAFPLESIYGPQNRRNALNAFITWCGLELPFNGVALSNDQAGTAPAGATITYTLTVTNTGNVTDLYDLTLAGQTWTTTLSTNAITIAADGTATFTVAVTIPESAQENDFDTVTVTVTSQTDGAIFDTATVTTTVVVEEEEWFLYLPIVTH